MPKFLVTGEVRSRFTVEVDAANERAAREMVKRDCAEFEGVTVSIDEGGVELADGERPCPSS